MIIFLILAKMPKANKPNGFLNFMICWKQQQEKLGRKFPNGMRDVQIDPECNDAWKVIKFCNNIKWIQCNF